MNPSKPINRLTRLLNTKVSVLFLFWLVLGWGFVWLAMLRLSSQAQLVLSVGLVALLVIIYLFSKWVRWVEFAQVLRLAVIFICSFLALRYMYWRATETLPMQFGWLSMVCGLLLFSAEIYHLVNTLLGFFINSNPLKREPLPMPMERRKWPTVDVFIPTYNEPPAVLHATVVAATQMDYPSEKLNVYILDDGGTTQKLNDPNPQKAAAAKQRADELKALADRFGAHYLTRERNLHAKAGNMNSALAHCNGELLAILDCDHVPTTDFARNLASFFLRDPKLFVVQTPHNFVTPDPLERNLRTFHHSPAENELFYDVMQPGLDSWDTSFFCGSAAMLRRSVIDELGGISGQTITEDAETTIDALGRGYRSAYFGRPMVSGLQPETFSGFVVQRARWAQGMWQIFILKNPWLADGLSFTQRLLYTNFSWYWLFSFARMIMLLAPPAFLVFSINLCDATALGLLAYAGPALFSSLIATQYFYGRVRWPFISQLYETIQCFYVSRALIEVVKKPRAPTFQVTPKGEQLDEHSISAMSWPFYILLIANLLAVGFGFYKLNLGIYSPAAIYFVLFWAILDTTLLIGALGVLLERKQTREEPRVAHKYPVRLKLKSGRVFSGMTFDQSFRGAGVEMPYREKASEALPPGTQVEMIFPEHNVRFHAIVMNQEHDYRDELLIGLRVDHETVAQERAANLLTYGSSEALIENNARRHEGRSILGGLFTVISFGLVEGRDHLLYWWWARLWPAIRRQFGHRVS